MGPFYTHDGPPRGPLMHDDAPEAIGSLASPDGSKPTGFAYLAGRDTAGVAVWRLVLGNIELPGRWVVIDREFMLAGPARAPHSPPEP
jgi:hypothetical protein